MYRQLCIAGQNIEFCDSLTPLVDVIVLLHDLIIHQSDDKNLYSMVGRWPGIHRCKTNRQEASDLLSSFIHWLSQSLRVHSDAETSVAALTGLVSDEMPIIDEIVLRGAWTKTGQPGVRHLIGGKYTLVRGTLLRENIFEDANGFFWECRGCSWQQMNKCGVRRLRQRLEPACIGQPATLRALAAKKGIILCRGDDGLPDAVLALQEHNWRVLWAGSGGWSKIHQVLRGEALPRYGLRRPRARGFAPKFNAHVLFRRWGIWAVTLPYGAPMKVHTKVLRVEAATGTVEIIHHCWKGIPWWLLRKLYNACEAKRRSSPGAFTDAIIRTAIMEVLPRRASNELRA